MLMSGAMLVARPSAKSTSSECRLRNPGNWDWQWSIRPRNRQRQFASAAPRNCIAQRRLGAGTAIGIGTIRTIRSGIHIITADTGTMGLAYGGTAAAAHRKRRANTTRTISPRQTRRRLRLRGTPILRWTRAAVDHPATRLDSGRLLQASFPWLINTASRENRHEISHIRPAGLESIGNWIWCLGHRWKLGYAKRCRFDRRTKSRAGSWVQFHRHRPGVWQRAQRADDRAGSQAAPRGADLRCHQDSAGARKLATDSIRSGRRSILRGLSAGAAGAELAGFAD